MRLLMMAAATGLVVGYNLVIRWGSQWGSREEERSQAMLGDDLLTGEGAQGAVGSLTMTRAVSLSAPAEQVWPWLAQMGRGAGWYSHDLLDNAGKPSARHLVSWIPEPQPGDASALGYLHTLEPGRSLVWWMDGLTWMGSWVRMAFCLQVTPEGGGSRLVIRISADGRGALAKLTLGLFQPLDCFMAVRQIQQIKDRVERYGARREDPERPETGSRDQYQYFEVIYASGERAGVPGREGAARARQAAIMRGILG